FDERADREAVCPGDLRSDHRELEPRHLVRADPARGLDRDAVVARPARRGRALGAVATERARAVLAGIGIRRAEVRDLAKLAEHPALRPAVVVGDDRGRTLTRAERRVAALAVPGRVEPGKAGRHARGRRDTRSD